MRRFLLCAAMCLIFSPAVRPVAAESPAPPVKELTSALTMYQWLLDQGEERAAAKFAQAVRDEFGGPWADLIVENARLRAELQSGGIRQTAAVVAEKTEIVSEIEQALRKKCSVHFETSPLDEFLRHIAEANDLNIVIDEQGLAEEGMTAESPITINVEEVMVKSVLQLVLQPIGLDYRIEDEVVKVTSKDRLAGEYKTLVYAVADLVVPIPHLTPAAPGEQLDRISETNPGDFDALIELITTTIAPDTWQRFGGAGVINAHEGTLSLIVRQSDQTHHGIADLLDQLRRLQNVQIEHTVTVYRIPASVAASLKLADGAPRVHGPAEGFERDLNEIAKASRVRITLFNGQTGTAQVACDEGTINILINSALNNDLLATPNGQTISVNLSAPESLQPGDVLAAVRSVQIPSGGTAWLHLPGRSTKAGPNGESMVLLVSVTSEVVTPEEQEELLGIGEP